MKDRQNFFLKSAGIIGISIFSGYLAYTYIQKSKKLSSKLNSTLKNFEKKSKNQLKFTLTNISKIIHGEIQALVSSLGKKSILEFLPLCDVINFQEKPFCTHELKLDEVYYECKDCSRMLDLYKAYGEKITDNINAITICEQCFDHTQHEGHKYYKRNCTLIGGMQVCNCGHQDVMKQQGNCKNHQGVQRQKIQELYEKIDKQFLQGFQDIFVTYFMSIMHFIDNSIVIKQKESQDYLLVLVKQFVDKIQEICELNSMMDTEVFQHYCDRYYLESFFEKQKNNKEKCQCTIFTQLVRFNQVYSLEMMKQLTELMKIMTFYSQEMQEIYGMVCIKNFEFLFILSDIDVQVDNGIQKISSFYPSPMTQLIVYMSMDIESPFKLIDKLGKDYINPMKFLATRVNKENYHMELMMTLLTICYEYTFTPTLKKLMKNIDFYETLILLIYNYDSLYLEGTPQRPTLDNLVQDQELFISAEEIVNLVEFLVGQIFRIFQQDQEEYKLIYREYQIIRQKYWKKLQTGVYIVKQDQLQQRQINELAYYYQILQSMEFYEIIKEFSIVPYNKLEFQGKR
ncbi:hypothetical protein PPERSA_01811 [Pseudocohnilembus persalinus]|uniref:E3 ubiquitin-protein ligase n=1 Tax=Pseudocohnilembus persalinus TaxID=266149 RepID=A0A0V0QKI7_PSEPJ|nr:hypothetical protein PPERSA_01811 [Pseudocohnilembus persalinus]|eukprot:KRX02694.1 hypothetical protein PPERSA_01811 [Pseudocohnilembus persalinus]